MKEELEEIVNECKEAWVPYFRIRKVEIPDLLIIATIILFVGWCMWEAIYGS
jgi:hypothetical protein